MRRLPLLLLLLLAACGGEGADDFDPRISSSYTTEAGGSDPALDPPPPPVVPVAPRVAEDGEAGDARQSGDREEAAQGGMSSAEAEREYHRGPRGGCYTYSVSGKKRYVDRSLCN